ncbi:hypothetical protein BDQ17DRAFT_1333562 [Cyathus striatus]|nr:hypothetical protein BDQ17DRAFT_1333562 [Cyathus striatus]
MYTGLPLGCTLVNIANTAYMEPTADGIHPFIKPVSDMEIDIRSCSMLPWNPIKLRQPKPKPSHVEFETANANDDLTDIKFLPSLEKSDSKGAEEEDDSDNVIITNEEIFVSPAHESVQFHLLDSEENKRPVKTRKKMNLIYQK